MQTVSSELSRKMVESYWTWMTIFQFFKPRQVLSFQALNRLMYKKGVSRCQEIISLRKAFFTLDVSKKWQNTVFVVFDNLDCS